MNPASAKSNSPTSSPRGSDETSGNTRPSPSPTNSNNSSSPAPSSFNITHGGLNINISESTQSTSLQPSTTARSSPASGSALQARRVSHLNVQMTMGGGDSSQLTITVKSKPENSPQQRQGEQPSRSANPTSSVQSSPQQQLRELPTRSIRLTPIIQPLPQEPMVLNGQDRNVSSVSSMFRARVARSEHAHQGLNLIRFNPSSSTRAGIDSGTDSRAAQQQQKRKSVDNNLTFPKRLPNPFFGSRVGCISNLGPERNDVVFVGDINNPDSDNLLPCPACQRRFADRISREEHMREVHYQLFEENNDD